MSSVLMSSAVFALSFCGHICVIRESALFSQPSQQVKGLSAEHSLLWWLTTIKRILWWHSPDHFSITSPSLCARQRVKRRAWHMLYTGGIRVVLPSRLRQKKPMVQTSYCYGWKRGSKSRHFAVLRLSRYCLRASSACRAHSNSSSNSFSLAFGPMSARQWYLDRWCVQKR